MSDDAEEIFREAHQAQMSGKLERAVELYRRSLALRRTAEAHTFLGWTYSFMGRYEDAIAECKRAIEVDPAFGNPYNDIGAYLIELGRHGEAIRWFQRAIGAARYEPRHYPWYNLARVHLHEGDLAEALRCLKAALGENPGYPAAFRELQRLQAALN